MVTFQGEAAVKAIEPWNDGREVEVSYFPMYSHFRLSEKMPSGIAERVDDNDVHSRDVEYLRWIVNNHTDYSFGVMLESDEFERKHVCYLIMATLSVIIDEYEAPEWEKYSSDRPSFIERGTLGVK